MKGFSHVFWKTRIRNNCIEFTYNSLDGEEGYPGNLNVKVTYRIVEKVGSSSKENPQFGLLIEYEATTDKTTIVNLTSHPYFNLSGHSKGNHSSLRSFG